MNRREAGMAMLLGGLGLAAPAAALAQGRGMGMGPMGDAERRHAMDTLRIGAVALESSRMAQRMARGPRVREFADLEAEEQTTVADIIREMSGMTPPPLDPEGRRMLDRLNAGRRGFDAAYVMMQEQGHQQLLDVQERYLRDGRNMHHRHIAMLARGRIREHLSDLQKLRAMRY
jgi:putative membrane protein